MQSCQAGGMKFCVHCKVKATVQLEVAEAGTMDRSVRLNQSLCHTSPARGKKSGKCIPVRLAQGTPLVANSTTKGHQSNSSRFTNCEF